MIRPFNGGLAGSEQAPCCRASARVVGSITDAALLPQQSSSPPKIEGANVNILAGSFISDSTKQSWPNPQWPPKPGVEGKLVVYHCPVRFVPPMRDDRSPASPHCGRHGRLRPHHVRHDKPSRSDLDDTPGWTGDVAASTLDSFRVLVWLLVSAISSGLSPPAGIPN